MEKCFCSVCGAHLFARDPDDPSRMGVRMSAFDSDPGVRPSAHQFVDDAATGSRSPTTACRGTPGRGLLRANLDIAVVTLALMDGLTINEAAQTTGWSARMLRYIEASGLVVPARTRRDTGCTDPPSFSGCGR